MALPTIDLRKKHILITGGTQGIGYGIAKQFAAAGAQLYLTYKWGSADSDEIVTEITAAGAPQPILIEADVADNEHTQRCMERIAQTTDRLDIFISNVTFAPQINSLAEYKLKSFIRTIEYSSWPLVSYTQALYKRFGTYPKNIVGISSDGPDHFYRGYDFVSASKALLENFARYMSIHLLPEGSSVNVVRFGTVRTASFNAIFGEQFFDFLIKNGGAKEHILTPDDCGKFILALCSGLMPALNGQVVTVDYGTPYKDNLMMRYLDSNRAT